MVIIATSVGGTTIEILKYLEGHPLKKWECPSEIGTVGNYESQSFIWGGGGGGGGGGTGEASPPPPEYFDKEMTP